MANISTDTQSERAKKTDIDYWLTIDRTDMELNGDPCKYHRTRDILDSLGVNDDYMSILLQRLRSRIDRGNANIQNNG